MTFCDFKFCEFAVTLATPLVYSWLLQMNTSTPLLLYIELMVRGYHEDQFVWNAENGGEVSMQCHYTCTMYADFHMRN